MSLIEVPNTEFTLIFSRRLTVNHRGSPRRGLQLCAGDVFIRRCFVRYIEMVSVCVSLGLNGDASSNKR